MYVESDTLNGLRAARDALVAEIEQLAARAGTASAERLDDARRRLAAVQAELDRLELAEELGRQRDA